MTDPVDLEELARRYLDLWQDQMSAMAADEDFARVVQGIMSAMGPAAVAGPAAWAAAWPSLMDAILTGGQGKHTDDQDERYATGTSAPCSPVGAEAPASAPHGGGDGLERLTRRIAALEKRLAELEAGNARPRASARKPARKRRS